jgi:zinc/manganese transport system ATP-binding protein
VTPPGTDAAPVVSLRDARVVRGGAEVWSGVDVDIGAGEFVAVLGPNGAGKSTLLQVVLGLLELDAGTVTVLGERAGARNDDIGYLPQRRTFDASMRIRGVDVVRLGVDGARWGLPLPRRLPGAHRARAAARRAHEVIERVGAAAYAERPIGELSGGEQQRLLIAQALARRPRVLILDEPLDSLDLPNQAAVASLLQRICREEGVAVILVGHDVNPILGYLDGLVYFAAGTAVQGTPEEVLTTATLSRLYASPVEVLTASDGRLVVVGTPEPPSVHGPRHAH